MRIGNCERSPFAGFPVVFIALVRVSASDGATIAAGIEHLTAVGFVVVLLSSMPTAPAFAAWLQMSKKVADARPGSLTSAMRPATVAGQVTSGLSTSA